MVRQWQQFFYDKRYTGTPIWSPDFVKLAAAYDIPGLHVTRPDEVRPRSNRRTTHPAPS
jgi:acetolactate synthase-1/2/3 large subunit